MNYIIEYRNYEWVKMKKPINKNIFEIIYVQIKELHHYKVPFEYTLAVILHNNIEKIVDYNLIEKIY